MVSFFLVFREFFRGLRIAWANDAFRAAFLILIVLLAAGTVFYSTVEGWDPLDSLYFSVITLATVGYGDFVPRTAIGKIFTIFYVFVGIGLFVGVAASLVRGYEKPRAKPQGEKNRGESG